MKLEPGVMYVVHPLDLRSSPNPKAEYRSAHDFATNLATAYGLNSVEMVVLLPFFGVGEAEVTIE